MKRVEEEIRQKEDVEQNKDGFNNKRTPSEYNDQQKEKERNISYKRLGHDDKNIGC
jgi:hypothetical protein